MILSSFFSGSTDVLISIKKTPIGLTTDSFPLKSLPSSEMVVEQILKEGKDTLVITLTFSHMSKKNFPERTQASKK